MKILLAQPHGFCAGVVMAIRSLEKALEMLGPPLFVYHEIVHNRSIVESFERQGVVFVREIDEVPCGANLLYSAHGVSPEIRREARARSLFTIDATCPLVAKVHLEAKRFSDQGYTIVLIGHQGHDEIVGVLGEAPERILLVENADEVADLVVTDPERVAYLTQTTLSLDDANRIITALRARFPRIVGPAKEDICYATQNRQEALRELAQLGDVVLVVGSQNSSNANRLVEVARSCGRSAFLVDGVDDLRRDWFQTDTTVVLTAGASTPEASVQACIRWLQDHFDGQLEERLIRSENVEFPLPKSLRNREPSPIRVQDPVHCDQVP